MAGIKDLLEFSEVNKPKIVDGNKIRVYRGYEKMPLSKRSIFNNPLDKGKYFTENLADAKWYSQRQNTLKGKVTYLDLVKDQFDKAKALSKSRSTRLAGEVIVDEELLKKQKVDILRSIMARVGNLTPLAMKGLNTLASLPVATIAMVLQSTPANADEANMTLEDFAKLNEGSTNVDKALLSELKDI